MSIGLPSLSKMPRFSQLFLCSAVVFLMGIDQCPTQDRDQDGYPSDVDCNDRDESIHPDAAEICDGVDQNCNDEVDEGVTTTYYFDGDSDGYGNANNTEETCSLPSGYVENADDCNDDDSNAYPGAVELCNEADDDCDGEIDEESQDTFYFDEDGDGYGDINQSVVACPPPEGYVAAAGDCDDLDPTVHPDANETCNMQDDNCNGEADEGMAIESVSSGYNHSLALCSDGTVWAWGRNNYGQLGDGSNVNRSTPVIIEGISGVSEVAAGGYHSLALRQDGTVWAWGRNGAGQLGNGTTTDSDIPIQVSDLDDITAISAGFEHSLALRSNQTVAAWGRNLDGQLGDGSNTDSWFPVSVSNLSTVTAIDAGSYHSLALKIDGTIRAWGMNEFGQLGDGTRDSVSTPVPVVGIINVAQISAGAYHSLALRNDYSVHAWGNNSNGQLGDGTTILRTRPTEIKDFTNIITVSGGATHSTAIASDGQVWTWGANESGQLGNGDPSVTMATAPTAAIAPLGATMISGGGYHNLLYFSDDGSVWSWGGNAFGQLGNGELENTFEAGEITDLP